MFETGHPRTLDLVIHKLLGSIQGKTILDVGCGLGENGWRLRVDHPFEEFQLFGVECFPPYVKFLRQYGLYNEIIEHEVPPIPIIDDWFDIVLCIEMIEHLTYEEGCKLLDEMERVSCHDGLIVVSTPFDAFERDWRAAHDNPRNEHLTTWKVKDFEALGYEVKVLRHPHLPRTIRPFETARRFLRRLPHKKIIFATKVVKE